MSRQIPVLSQLRASGLAFSQNIRGPAAILVAAAAVFLLVAGVGAATSYLRASPEATASSGSESDDPSLARLNDYTRSIGAKEKVATPPAGKLLPDVSTMIERLAARLESAPDDAKGWRMLGWSYYNTARYKQAEAAYARAFALDPNSHELKLEYEEAKAKAAEGGNHAAATPLPTTATGKGHDGPGPKEVAAFDAMPQHDRNAAIKAMVDGLADRLERSPQDVEGWTRLMRSRIVLGEREVAATAFRKALDVFKDDTDASARITAAAIEFGLKAK
jgi:cytochrome c-type biogenesis protein CcmH